MKLLERLSKEPTGKIVVSVLNEDEMITDQHVFIIEITDKIKDILEGGERFVKMKREKSTPDVITFRMGFMHMCPCESETIYELSKNSIEYIKITNDEIEEIEIPALGLGVNISKSGLVDFYMMDEAGYNIYSESVDIKKIIEKVNNFLNN